MMQTSCVCVCFRFTSLKVLSETGPQRLPVQTNVNLPGDEALLSRLDPVCSALRVLSSFSSLN